jgi:hypothetical protein
VVRAWAARSSSPWKTAGSWDGGHGLDAVIAPGRGERVATGGTDPEQPDAPGIDLVPGGEEGNGGLEVLHALGGILQPAGQATGLALVGGIEGEGDEAAFSHQLRVGTGGLLLDAGPGVPDDQRRPRPGSRRVGGVEVRGERDAGAVETDGGPGHG